MGVATAALAVAAVGTAASINSSAKAQSAAKSAINKQKGAAIESAQFLADQGRKGSNAIRDAGMTAAQTAEGISGQAIAPLQRFADIGKAGFDQYSSNIMNGGLGSLSGIAGNVAGAASGATAGYDLSDPVQAELARKAGISGEAAGRGFMDPLGSVANMGVSTAGDIANITGRGYDRLGDIATSTAAGRSGALVGAAPLAQQALSGAGEARALSNFAGQRFNAQALESLSRLVGENI